jgi:hypothetical protein
MTSKLIHKCHYPQCEITVDPSLHMCQAHWFSIPVELRENLISAYRDGQELDERPSREYVLAAMAIRKHVTNELGHY